MTISRHFLDVAGRRVHYRKAGSGPPLLMIHQSPRSSAEYEPLMERWSEHFTCIAPDSPGFGQSDPLPGDPTIDDFADAIVAFADAAGLECVPAYGFHSGGIILVTALRRHPRRFAALAIGGYGIWTEEERAIFGESYLPPLEPSAYGEHLTWLWNRMLEQSWFFPWFDVRHQARLRMAHADPVKVDAAVREMLDSGDAYRAGYGAVLRAPRDIPAPGEGTAPVLITAYDGDPLQAHLARLGELPESWVARRVSTPAAHQDESFAFLSIASGEGRVEIGEADDEGFVRVAAEGFDGLVHWRGDRAAERVVLHAPGGSVELLDAAGSLLIDLPGHGLSDPYDGDADIAAWSRLTAAAIEAICPSTPQVVAGEGVSGLLALAIAARLGAEAEAFDAHIPRADAAGEWIERQPDLVPDRFGNYLTEAWGAVRAARFFWPWFRADPAHAIPFDPEDVAPERLALRHRALVRARAAKPLLRALLTADRAALVAGAPSIGRWDVAEWGRDNPEIRGEIWLPEG